MGVQSGSVTSGKGRSRFLSVQSWPGLCTAPAGSVPPLQLAQPCGGAGMCEELPVQYKSNISSAGIRPKGTGQRQQQHPSSEGPAWRVGKGSTLRSQSCCWAQRVAAGSSLYREAQPLSATPGLSLTVSLFAAGVPMTMGKPWMVPTNWER